MRSSRIVKPNQNLQNLAVMVDPNLKPARSGDLSELWRGAATVGQMSGGLTAELALRMLHLRWVMVALIAICCASPPPVQAQTRSSRSYSKVEIDKKIDQIGETCWPKYRRPNRSKPCLGQSIPKRMSIKNLINLA